MDACIAALDGWHRDLAVVLRFTGLRAQQAMWLTWDDLDLSNARLRIRGELGKSKQEQRGRIVPVSPHLVRRLTASSHEDRFVVPCNRNPGPRRRLARARDTERGWKRAEVRPEAWEGRPHHAFRKGFVSELKRSSADTDAVEFLVGHSLGLRGVYTDPDALPLRETIAKIPPLVLPGSRASTASIRTLKGP